MKKFESHHTRVTNTRSATRNHIHRLLLLLFLLLGSVGAKAADYVFIYDGGYLAVNDNGQIVYTTTFSPQCVWTCVSNTTTLENSNLLSTGNNNNASNNNRRFLYTTINNQQYWLVGSTTNGTAITTTTNAPGTAYWLNIDSRHGSFQQK